MTRCHSSGLIQVRQRDADTIGTARAGRTHRELPGSQTPRSRSLQGQDRALKARLSSAQPSPAPPGSSLRQPTTSSDQPLPLPGPAPLAAIGDCAVLGADGSAAAAVLWLAMEVRRRLLPLWLQGLALLWGRAGIGLAQLSITASPAPAHGKEGRGAAG